MINRKSLFIAACLGMTTVGIAFISLGSILPLLINKFSLAESEAGIITVMLPAGILVGSLAFGPIVDSFSYRSLLTTSMFLSIVGLVFTAMSDSYGVLLLSFFIVGLGSGSVNGATNALVSDVYSNDPRTRSSYLSLLAVFFGVGALIMPLFMGALTSRYDYTIAVYTVSVSFVPVMIFFWLLNYPEPKQVNKPDLKNYARLSRDPVLLGLCFILFFQSGLEGIANNWTTTLLENSRSYEPRDALFSLSIYASSFTLSRLIISRISRVWGPERVLGISLFILQVACTALIFPTGPLVFSICLIALGIGCAAWFPLVLGYIGSLHSRMSGTAFSLAFVLALTGNMITNYFMGYFSEMFSLEVYGYFLFAGSIAIGAIYVLTLRGLRNKGVS